MALFQVEYKDDGRTEFMVHFNTLASAQERFARKQHAAVYLCTLRAMGLGTMSRELINAKGSYVEPVTV